MTHVATVIANPARPAIDDARLRALRGHLPPGETRWLEPGVAADLFFTPGAPVDARTLAHNLRQTLGDAPCDVVVQPVLHRRKKLFVADMDSTMIGQECIDELADVAGLKAHVSEITERAMRGEIAFEPALRERVALLKGLSADVVDDVIASRIRLTPGGPELVRTMRANGAYTALVSGGFTLFTARIAEAIGFQEHRANTLLIEGEAFSGAVAEPILGREAKLASLRELRDARALDPALTLAVGDGANDLAMLEEAGLGVAYHAKPAVAAAAHARIDHGDLTALLYAQGYERGEFVRE